MCALWTWTLDTAAAPSMRAAASTVLVSNDTLSSLSRATVEVEASSDEIVWRDFRPNIRRPSRSERKRARLHRFDSDDDDKDQAIELDREEEEEEERGHGAGGAGESEGDEASGLGQTSSEGSVTGDEQEVQAGPGSSETKIEEGVIATERPLTIKDAGETRRGKQPETTRSSVQLIAHAIHKHAFSDNDANQVLTVDSNPPPPLTYKETARLVRLIAMIFRFPKSSRRTIRRRRPTSNDSSSSIASTSALTAQVNAAASPSTPDTESSTSAIELKPKYLVAASSSSSTSRTRILARVHPEDARPASSAVLKLIALVPVALPARIACVDWIVGLAVRARRDEYGNILLPNAAYENGIERVGSEELDREKSSEAMVKKEEIDEGKATRSKRLLGQEAPCLPLPGFWRRACVHATTVEEGQARIKVDEHEAASTEGSDSQMDDSQVEPFPSTTPSPSPLSTQDEPLRHLGARNLSKLLAERMRDKRQAKTLLLRTHHSLRKKRRDAEHEPDRGAHSDHVAVEEDEQVEVDAETLSNTIANSARANARATILGLVQDESREMDVVDDDKDGNVTVKHEDA